MIRMEQQTMNAFADMRESPAGKLIVAYLEKNLESLTRAHWQSSDAAIGGKCQMLDELLTSIRNAIKRKESSS
ncbi:MAG: hypothetical protein AMXMBFR84_26120 [Candidatus Hydrogenedentota bacterium]